MKNVVIVRNRGQITIPDSIRKAVGWVNPMSAISITVVKPDEIVMRPQMRVVDRNKLWEMIERSRSLGNGRATQSAAEFLERDRKSH